MPQPFIPDSDADNVTVTKQTKALSSRQWLELLTEFVLLLDSEGPLSPEKDVKLLSRKAILKTLVP